MEKITFGELDQLFRKHNILNGVTRQFDDPNSLSGVVVFKKTGVNEFYCLRSRSYRFFSDNKYFIPGMHGNSIFAHNLDGTDPAIRLDWYLGAKGWEIDYCYIEE